MFRRALLVFALLSLTSCSTPAAAPLRVNRKAPDIITSLGIEVFIRGTIHLYEPELIARFIDAQEKAIRADGIDIPLSKVYIFGPGELFMIDQLGRKVPLSGMAYRNAPGRGLAIVWWQGAGGRSYGHERLHQAGYAHSRDGKDTWFDEKAAEIELNAIIAGSQVLREEYEKSNPKKTQDDW